MTRREYERTRDVWQYNWPSDDTLLAWALEQPDASDYVVTKESVSKTALKKLPLDRLTGIPTFTAEQVESISIRK